MNTPLTGRRWTFDRADLLGTRLTLLVIAALATLGGLVLPALGLVRGDPLTRTVAVPGDTVPDLPLRAGATATDSGEVALSLADPSMGTRIAGLLPGLALALAMIVVAVLVLRLLGRLSDDQPFLASSVSLLRGFALVLLIGPLLVGAFSMIADLAVTGAAYADGAAVHASLDLGPYLLVMALGLIVAAIAEAFARGAQLEAELDGLV